MRRVFRWSAKEKPVSSSYVELLGAPTYFRIANGSKIINTDQINAMEKNRNGAILIALVDNFSEVVITIGRPKSTLLSCIIDASTPCIPNDDPNFANVIEPFPAMNESNRSDEWASMKRVSIVIGVKLGRQ